jgi:hypothetical protein
MCTFHHAAAGVVAKIPALAGATPVVHSNVDERCGMGRRVDLVRNEGETLGTGADGALAPRHGLKPAAAAFGYRKCNPSTDFVDKPVHNTAPGRTRRNTRC